MRSPSLRSGFAIMVFLCLPPRPLHIRTYRSDTRWSPCKYSPHRYGHLQPGSSESPLTTWRHSRQSTSGRFPRIVSPSPLRLPHFRERIGRRRGHPCPVCGGAYGSCVDYVTKPDHPLLTSKLPFAILWPPAVQVVYGGDLIYLGYGVRCRRNTRVSTGEGAFILRGCLPLNPLQEPLRVLSEGSPAPCPPPPGALARGAYVAFCRRPRRPASSLHLPQVRSAGFPDDNRGVSKTERGGKAGSAILSRMAWKAARAISRQGCCTVVS